MHARGNDGERLFSSDEFLTSQQISSFFSHLATKKSLLDKDDTEENDDEAAEFESSLEDLTNQVRREVSLQHPIVFDCHNMCDLVKQGKLNKFSIKMLKRLCEHFDLDVSHITVRRKRPCVDKLSTFCCNCLCQQENDMIRFSRDFPALTGIFFYWDDVFCIYLIRVLNLGN